MFGYRSLNIKEEDIKSNMKAKAVEKELSIIGVTAIEDEL